MRARSSICYFATVSWIRHHRVIRAATWDSVRPKRRANDKATFRGFVTDFIVPQPADPLRPQVYLVPASPGMGAAGALPSRAAIPGAYGLEVLVLQFPDDARMAIAPT